tara:strand:- start:552 stop:1211 length:660 start_codon:yes stop_codon:yes gene_type:complete
MDKNNVDTLLAWLTSRFPDWKSTTEILCEWGVIFERYDNVARVEKALRELLRETTYSKPVIKTFLRIMGQSRDVEANDNENPFVITGLFIQCVTPEEGSRSMAGWYVPLVFTSRRAPDSRYWHDYISKMREKYELFYHGQWQIIDCRNEPDAWLAMDNNRRNLLEKFGIAVVPTEFIQRKRAVPRQLATPRKPRPWKPAPFGLEGVSKMDAIKQLRANP